jgi:N6-L-threonylcarbamoyladenine synthase
MDMLDGERPARVLGIETSCDETAASVIERSPNGAGRIVANLVRSQLKEHAPYGGVVPEIAARAHLDVLPALIERAMAEAGLDYADLDAVAATAGPGLIGGLLVGLTMGKAIALAHDKPLIAVNHLEAHALTPGLTDGLSPPYALLLVSGGHTQIMQVHGVGDYTRLGTTIDDALGEAFDKVAKLLGLGFPGGPAVERAALTGDPHRFALPRPLAGRSEPNFSFAGLKTAIRRQAQALVPLGERDCADLCASFQQAVCDVVADRLDRALPMSVAATDRSSGAPHCLVVAGGVAANRPLRASLAAVTQRHGFRLVIPPPALCTDNAAMIAWAGAERLARGLIDGLAAPARARWPLDADAAPLIGSGRLGTKA